MRIALILSLACLLTTSNVSGEEYSYKESKANRESINTWTRAAVRSGRIELTAIKKATGEFDKMISDAACFTLEWFYTNQKKRINLHAVRKNGTVDISGEVNGKPVKKTIRLETDAWCQFAEFAISRMLAARQNSMVYSLFWPDKMSFYKMKAARIGEEKIRINGKDVDTIKVKVTLSGFKSIFWSSKYWFRKSDYLFVRYEGVNGLAGTDATVIELISR